MEAASFSPFTAPVTSTGRVPLTGADINALVQEDHRVPMDMEPERGQVRGPGPQQGQAPRTMAETDVNAMVRDANRVPLDMRPERGVMAEGRVPEDADAAWRPAVEAALAVLPADPVKAQAYLASLMKGTSSFRNARNARPRRLARTRVCVPWEWIVLFTVMAFVCGAIAGAAM